MVRTFLKVYMELGSYFLFQKEQIKDIIIIGGRGGGKAGTCGADGRLKRVCCGLRTGSCHGCVGRGKLPQLHSESLKQKFKGLEDRETVTYRYDNYKTPV